MKNIKNSYDYVLNLIITGIPSIPREIKRGYQYVEF